MIPLAPPHAKYLFMGITCVRTCRSKADKSEKPLGPGLPRHRHIPSQRTGHELVGGFANVWTWCRRRRGVVRSCPFPRWSRNRCRKPPLLIPASNSGLRVDGPVLWHLDWRGDAIPGSAAVVEALRAERKGKFPLMIKIAAILPSLSQ